MATAKKVLKSVSSRTAPAKKAAAKKVAAKKVTARKAANRAPSAAGNSPDAIAFLIKQHRDAKKLFMQFEKADRKAEKEKIANTVCKMLQVHTKIEEEIFYPACRAAGLDADQMDEADVEHASAKDLIAQVEGKNPSDSHYDAKVKVLGEYVNHHVEEEQTEMFKAARRLKLNMTELGAQLKSRSTALEIELGLQPATGMQKNRHPSGSIGIEDRVVSKAPKTWSVNVLTGQVCKTAPKRWRISCKQILIEAKACGREASAAPYLLQARLVDSRRKWPCR